MALSTCGCKGIRFCASCEHTERVQKLKFDNKEHDGFTCFVWDGKRNVAVATSQLHPDSSIEEIEKASTSLIGDEECFEIDGLLLIPDFIDEKEEEYLMDRIDRVEWALSQSGRRKQDYGPQVNFKHKKVKTTKFVGMPDYADLLLDKMRNYDEKRLGEYIPFEMCNLEYEESRKSAIEMHQDDMWIWGNRLISINLINGSVMTMSNEKERKLLFVWMPHRSLLCMAECSRYSWKHGVLSHHIKGRRIALTMREAALAFQPGGELYEKYGKNLIDISRIRVPLEGKSM
ncbi:hypothetical protein PFISCL1PPCAC_10578 [Pristionchus fissidentatus]|uniref:Alpha-ketoglutarate-dependent dioxygenase AlkB-like domain-containing protein n=1 Tax=Pristionchus fissidentatus TaxID=1538716 RepID=A0AAV5VL09_9BILA|nr:hypothetical protein PFISCL1PPCAC_10578 [Pristionchus fissidentatus]